MNELDEIKKQLADLQEKIAKVESKTYKFYKGQPVLVCDDNENWERLYFIEYVEGRACPFQAGTKAPDGKLTWQESFAFCKPDQDAPITIELIKHDGGECPVDPDELVVVFYKDSFWVGTGSGEASGRTWGEVEYYTIKSEWMK